LIDVEAPDVEYCAFMATSVRTKIEAPVLARRRQELILDEVQASGAVRVSDLTIRFRVSDMTIRRDLDVLASLGMLEKVHGGATAATKLVQQRTTYEPGFEAKSHRQIAEKRAIAHAAAKLIAPGTAVGITAGTTTWQLAHELSSIPELTVVTNSIRVAEVLHVDKRADLTVVLTGGIRTPSDALVGPVAVSALRSLHVDQVFMGVHGMAEQSGFTTPNLMEAETNRAFIDAAQELVVLADHTKWGLHGLSTIAPLSQASLVVSDDALPAGAQELLRNVVARVSLVASSAGRSRTRSRT
jgi:DeoR/GlpR family transcriptional regulator of sugar metabolism